MQAQPVVLLVYNIVCLLGTIAWLINGYSASSAPSLPFGKMVLFSSLLGALGGAMHGLASVVWHTGRGTYDAQWTMFYVGRPFLGAGMAVMTLLVLRSGVGGFNVENELALFAWAALAGLYSQPALDKLRDVFAAIFRTESRTNPVRQSDTASASTPPDSQDASAPKA
jgi:hypothetical protein